MSDSFEKAVVADREAMKNLVGCSRCFEHVPREEANTDSCSGCAATYDRKYFGSSLTGQTWFLPCRENCPFNHTHKQADNYFGKRALWLCGLVEPETERPLKCPICKYNYIDLIDGHCWMCEPDVKISVPQHGCRDCGKRFICQNKDTCEGDDYDMRFVCPECEQDAIEGSTSVYWLSDCTKTLPCVHCKRLVADHKSVPMCGNVKCVSDDCWCYIRSCKKD